MEGGFDEGESEAHNSRAEILGASDLPLQLVQLSVMDLDLPDDAQVVLVGVEDAQLDVPISV